VVLRALQTSGQDAQRIAGNAGVHPRHLRGPTGRVPQSEMTALWHAAVEATGNPCFGLDVSRFVTPTTFGALSG
jgi:Arabinose-binding domain of AraC transcription regulator, N-term